MNSLLYWDRHGVLPPIDRKSPTSSYRRSPFEITVRDFVESFASSRRRKEILSGLLQFRFELQQAGFVQGFQWFNGSFLENVEFLESRDPEDLDVVTFYVEPEGRPQRDLVSEYGATLLDHGYVKERYLLDSYWVNLHLPPKLLVKKSAYWYSLWSHRRNEMWKGFLQVDLEPKEDWEFLSTMDELLIERILKDADRT